MSFAKYAAVLALTFQAVLRDDEAAEDELMEVLDDIWYALSPADRLRVDALAAKFASGELSRSAFIADFAQHEAREHAEQFGYGEPPVPTAQLYACIGSGVYQYASSFVFPEYVDFATNPSLRYTSTPDGDFAANDESYALERFAA